MRAFALDNSLDVSETPVAREPHLHVGAIVPGADVDFPIAAAVPITFGGRYLRTNDVVRVGF
jgi:hypothetical protein